MHCFSLLVFLLLAAVEASRKKTVSFGDVTEIDSDVVPSRHSAPISKSSGRSTSSSRSHRSRGSVFESEEEEDDIDFILNSKTPERKRPQTSSSPRQTQRKEEVKKPSAGLGRFKNRGPIANPVLDTFLTLLDAFIGAFQETVRNEFIDPEEVDAYERQHGQVMNRRDPADMALRIARPAGWLAANMWGFFDFPFSPQYWGLMLIVNILILLSWRQYDMDWMVSEMGHWDYALGLAIFLTTGLISLLHQGVNFLTKIFFGLAPSLILAVYIGILSYAAFKKPHHYYS